MDSLIAVLGTLAGAVVTGLLHRFVAARSERAARREQKRRDQMDAVTVLACAATDHRRTMYTRHNLKQSGAPSERLEQAKAESYLTRSAVTGPLVRLRLLVDDPGVRHAATDLVAATYALRDAADQSDLDQRRRSALAAHDHFVETAASYLA